MFSLSQLYIWQDYISDIAEAVLQNEDEDFSLECLGVMGNLTIPDLDYELILKEYKLVPWIKHKLQRGELAPLISSFLLTWIACVAVVKCCPVLHHCVVLTFFWSFWTMDHGLYNVCCLHLKIKFSSCTKGRHEQLQ